MGAKIGKCCCKDCCTDFATKTPQGWQIIGGCCAAKIVTPTDDWVKVCSDPFLTCRKDGTLNLGIYFYKTPVIECTAADGAGYGQCIQQQFQNPRPCFGEEFLCTEIKYTTHRLVEFRIAYRYKPTSIQTYVTRVKCNGGCKWYFRSIRQVQLQWGRLDSVSFKRTAEPTSGCCNYPPFSEEQLPIDCATFNFNNLPNQQTFYECGEALLDDFPTAGQPITFTLGTGLCDDTNSCLPTCPGTCPWEITPPAIPQATIDALCQKCPAPPTCTEQLLVRQNCEVFVHWVNPINGAHSCTQVPNFAFTRDVKTVVLGSFACAGFPTQGFPNAIGISLLNQFNALLKPSCQIPCRDDSLITGSLNTVVFSNAKCLHLDYTESNQGLPVGGTIKLPCPTSWGIKA